MQWDYRNILFDQVVELLEDFAWMDGVLSGVENVDFNSNFSLCEVGVTTGVLQLIAPYSFI